MQHVLFICMYVCVWEKIHMEYRTHMYVCVCMIRITGLACRGWWGCSSSFLFGFGTLFNSCLLNEEDFLRKWATGLLGAGNLLHPWKRKVSDVSHYWALKIYPKYVVYLSHGRFWSFGVSIVYCWRKELYRSTSSGETSQNVVQNPIFTLPLLLKS